MLMTLGLSYYVITKESAATRYDYKFTQQDTLSRPTHSISSTSEAQGGGLWTVLFAWYSLLIHILVFAFPMRSCYAIFDITRSLTKAARGRSLRDFKLSHRRRGSSTSLSSSETLTSSKEDSLPSSTTSSEIGDIEPEFYTDGDAESDRIVHAIVIPNYKEEVDSLRETLDVLASHPQARDSYDVSDFFPLCVEFNRKTRLVSFRTPIWTNYVAPFLP